MYQYARVRSRNGSSGTFTEPRTVGVACVLPLGAVGRPPEVEADIEPKTSVSVGLGPAASKERWDQHSARKMVHPIGMSTTTASTTKDYEMDDRARRILDDLNSPSKYADLLKIADNLKVSATMRSFRTSLCSLAHYVRYLDYTRV